MQFPDGGHIGAGCPNPVMPGGNGTVIDHRVVPVTGLMRITTRRQGGAGRAAKRTRAIRVGKPNTPGCDTVQGRRFDHRVTGSAQKISIMVVGQEEN